MGSFYLTCSISNMTLNHQKTSVQLLVPKYNTSQYSSLSFEEHMNIICSNDAAQAFFSPFGFPIHGEYEDCGQIDEIKRDKNVEQLEEFFGISIEDIIAGISRTKKGEIENLKNEDIYLSLGMTFFRTEVLEFLQSGWIAVNLVNPKKYYAEEYLKKFLDDVKKIPDKALIEQIMAKKIARETLTDDETDIFFETFNTSIWERCYIKCSRESNFLKILPIDFVEQQDDIVKQWFWVEKIGWGLNRILIPSSYGSQDVNFIETYKLNEFVNDLLIEDIKYYYDGSSDDDVEDNANRIITTHNRNKAFNKLGI